MQQRAERWRSEKPLVHAMLSFEPDMNWMNTSSRLVSPALDLHALVLARPRRAPPRAPRLSEPTTCSVGRTAPPARRPGLPWSAAATCSSRGPAPRRCQPGISTTSSTVPRGQHLAIGDVADAVAALGLVHVVGRDQHRQPAAASRWISSQNSRRALGSTPAVGSSSSSSFGLCMMQAASASRCFQPPDSVPASCLRALGQAEVAPASGRHAPRPAPADRAAPRIRGSRAIVRSS